MRNPGFGTEMNEAQCYALMLEHLAGVRDCMRGMAQLRGDMRWLVPVQLMDQMQDRIKAMMHRPGASIRWMPERTKP